MITYHKIIVHLTKIFSHKTNDNFFPMHSFSDIIQNFKQKKIKIEQDKPLAPYTTMGIGGNAKYLVSAFTKDQLHTIISISKANDLPYIIIGKGSNLIISDKGFSGLAIINELKQWEILSNGDFPDKSVTPKHLIARVDSSIINNPKLKYRDTEEKDVFIRVESGARLQSLIKSLLNRQITGLQWFAGIPASIGGAIYMNMHGGPEYISNFVMKASLTDGAQIRDVTQDYFQFDYDYSILHQTKEIVLSVDLNLKYGDVSQVRKFIRDWASLKSGQPMHSAGCVFKNLSPEQQRQLNLTTPSTGYIIDKILNLKGYRRGGAQISKFNAAFIENLQNARSADVYYLIQLIKDEALKKLNLNLETEVQLVGDFG